MSAPKSIDLRTHRIDGEPLSEAALKVAAISDDLVDEIKKAMPEADIYQLFYFTISSAGAAVCMKQGGVPFDDMICALLMKVEECVRSLPAERQDEARQRVIATVEGMEDMKIAETGIITVNRDRAS